MADVFSWPSRRYRLRVRTEPSQGSNRGSNPLSATRFTTILRPLFRKLGGSMLASGQMRGPSRSAVVLLALTLLFSTAQCMVACAAAPCQSDSQSNLPPCHRHPAPANHASSACSHPLTASAGRSLNAHMALPQFFAAPLFSQLACLVPPPAIDQQAIPLSPSPPGTAAVSTVILRI